MELKLVLLILIFSLVMIILLSFKWKELEEIKKEQEESKKKKLPPLDILEEDSNLKSFLRMFSREENKLQIPIGINGDNNVRTIDLKEINNLLVIGTTGGGKSICLNEMITSLSLFYEPKEIRIVAIDTSIVELSSFNRIPHYIKEALSNPKEIIEELQLLQQEAERRIRTQNKQDLLVVIDDLYDVCSYDPNALKMMEKLLAISKEANIHFILATDTPTKELITNGIKENIQGFLYLTLAPGEEKEFFFGKDLTEEELTFLTEIGSLIYQEQDQKERIKIPEVTDTELKSLKSWFTYNK